MLSRYSKTFISTAIFTLVASASLLLATAAQATPVVIHDPEGNVVEILGLELNGEFFDDEFAYGNDKDVVEDGDRFGSLDFNDQLNSEQSAGGALLSLPAIPTFSMTSISVASTNRYFLN
jgi:hypothetical protein